MQSYSHAPLRLCIRGAGRAGASRRHSVIIASHLQDRSVALNGDVVDAVDGEQRIIWTMKLVSFGHYAHSFFEHEQLVAAGHVERAHEPGAAAWAGVDDDCARIGAQRGLQHVGGVGTIEWTEAGGPGNATHDTSWATATALLKAGAFFHRKRFALPVVGAQHLHEQLLQQQADDFRTTAAAAAALRLACSMIDACHRTL